MDYLNYLCIYHRNQAGKFRKRNRRVKDESGEIYEMKKILIIIYLITFLSVIGILTWQLFFQSNIVDIPQEIDSLKLSSNIKGQQAINSISKLHGVAIENVDDGYILVYKDTNGFEATIWLTVSKDSITAKQLFKIMDSKVPNNKIFSDRQEIIIDNHNIVTVNGMNLTHYYWSEENKNFWVALSNNNKGLQVIEKVIAIRW